MIFFVYLVIGIAFFHVYGFGFKRFRITGEIIRPHFQKLSSISLVVSVFILIAFGFLIIYSSKKIGRKNKT
jgi:hypothetical protein